MTFRSAFETEPAVQTVNELDNVMEELATADWWTLDAEHVATQQPAERIVKDVAAVRPSTESSASEQRSAAAVIGLALSSATGRRQMKKQDDE